MYLCDYHMHSHNSTDGQNSVMELCQRAVELGLKEVAITDHFEPVKGNEGYKQYNPKWYFIDVLKARVVFKYTLKIKLGIELGQPHLYSKYSIKLIEEYPYDYVLGSAHNLPGDVDLGTIDYSNADIKYYSKEYLRQLKKLAQWNQFDCIGHLDLPKRYAAVYGISISLMEYYEDVEEVLKILIRNGKGIEINTSGLRQHSKACLPSLDIVKLFKDLGGEVLTVGSDAHRADEVGEGIQEGIELAKAAGFKYITVFNNRKPEWKKIA
ncbi:MAG: histidinol-phosphatase family [Clostridiales bacterium]|nr:histidinol-phosphatase family [Clostridiales bacterium]